MVTPTSRPARRTRSPEGREVEPRKAVRTEGRGCSRALAHSDHRRSRGPDRAGWCAGDSRRRRHCRVGGSTDPGPAQPGGRGWRRRSHTLVSARRPWPRPHQASPRSGPRGRARRQRVRGRSWCCRNDWCGECSSTHSNTSSLPVLSDGCSRGDGDIQIPFHVEMPHGLREPSLNTETGPPGWTRCRSTTGASAALSSKGRRRKALRVGAVGKRLPKPGQYAVVTAAVPTRARVAGDNLRR